MAQLEIAYFDTPRAYVDTIGVHVVVHMPMGRKAEWCELLGLFAILGAVLLLCQIVATRHHRPWGVSTLGTWM